MKNVSSVPGFLSQVFSSEWQRLPEVENPDVWFFLVSGFIRNLDIDLAAVRQSVQDRRGNCT
jgi:hypothetical protein